MANWLHIGGAVVLLALVIFLVYYFVFREKGYLTTDPCEEYGLKRHEFEYSAKEIRGDVPSLEDLEEWANAQPEPPKMWKKMEKGYKELTLAEYRHELLRTKPGDEFVEIFYDRGEKGCLHMIMT